MRIPRLALVACCALLAACTTRMRLVDPAAVAAVQPLPVRMEPPLSSLEDRATSGNMTVVVPTGELLAYYFSGSERGGESRATLQLVDSRLQLDVSESRGMGSLGLLDTPMYLSMVGGYSCQYALVVEALKPDGTRRQLTARGEGRARNDGQAAVRYAVTQAAADLREQVAALLADGGTSSADR